MTLDDLRRQATLVAIVSQFQPSAFILGRGGGFFRHRLRYPKIPEGPSRKGGPLVALVHPRFDCLPGRRAQVLLVTVPENLVVNRADGRSSRAHKIATIASLTTSS